MKIHLYDRDFPVSGVDFVGGLTKAVHGLACGFVANGASVAVICHGPETRVVRAGGGYEIRCFKRHLSASIGIGPRADDLDRYIGSCDNSDVFILNGVFNPGVQLVSRACRRYGRAYVCWPHDPYDRPLFTKRSYIKWPYWFFCDRPILRRAKAIQVFDPRHGDLLRQLRVSTPTVEMVDGIDPSEIITESRLSWREEGRPKLIFLGRFDYYNKALDVLLDAFAVITRVVDAELTLQGPDAGDKEMLQRRAQRLGVADKVVFKDPQYQRTAAEILNDYDVFVLPSRFEGFSLAALEAMIAARVVIIPKISGIAPHVRAVGCGVEVEPTVESVRAGVLQLLAVRPRWRDMGLAGRNYALTHFSWNRIAAELLAQYQPLMSNA